MRKTIFIILCCFIGLGAHAQSLSKSLAWMKEHKAKIFLPRSYANGIVHANEVTFNEDYISLWAPSGNQTTIPWNKIISIYETKFEDDGEITLLSSEKPDVYAIGITLSIEDHQSRSKFLKALKKVARKKGAKFTEKELPID